MKRKRKEWVLINRIIGNILRHTILVTMHLQIQQQPIWNKLRAEKRQINVFPIIIPASYESGLIVFSKF